MIFDPDEDLDNEVPVFTQYEAWVLAFAVAQHIDENAELEDVGRYVEEVIPDVLNL